MTTDTSGHEMALAQAEAMIERQADEIARLRDELSKLRVDADEHDSDCATHNEPAYPNGPCDCSAAMQKGE